MEGVLLVQRISYCDSREYRALVKHLLILDIVGAICGGRWLSEVRSVTT